MTAIATTSRTGKGQRKVCTAILEKDSGTRKPSATDGEISAPEKDILCSIVRESDELPYPLRPLEMAFGPAEQAYDIPEESKAEVLKSVWPFEECPGMDDELFDLHESRYFRFGEAQVIRCRGRNLMVSPYYAHSGGMAVDFLTREALEDTGEPTVMKAKE